MGELPAGRHGKAANPGAQQLLRIRHWFLELLEQFAGLELQPGRHIGFFVAGSRISLLGCLTQVIHPVFQQHLANLPTDRLPLRGIGKAGLLLMPGLQHGAQDAFQFFLFEVSQALHRQLAGFAQAGQGERDTGVFQIGVGLNGRFGQ